MEPKHQNEFSRKLSGKDIEEFATRIKKRAEEQRMSLNKLTIRLGWGGGLLNKILKGQRSIKRDLIKEIAQALNCSPDKLVEGTMLASMMQSIEPTVEQQNIADLRTKIEQLGDEIQAYKKQEDASQLLHENLSKENQKLNDDLRIKEVELTNHKKILEENARLKSNLNQTQNEVLRLRSIAESERTKNISLKRAYDGQQVWIETLRVELENAHQVGNFKAVLAGFGGLFLGSLYSNTDGSSINSAFAASESIKKAPKR